MDSDIVLMVVLPTSILFMPLGRMSKICKPCGWNAQRICADIKDPVFMVTN
jgi:hypothetical protein